MKANFTLAGVASGISIFSAFVVGVLWVESRYAKYVDVVDTSLEAKGELLDHEIDEREQQLYYYQNQSSLSAREQARMQYIQQQLDRRYASKETIDSARMDIQKGTGK